MSSHVRCGLMRWPLLVQAMETAARKGPGVHVLHAILPGLEDRNADISAKVCRCAQESCASQLGEVVIFITRGIMKTRLYLL